MEKQMKKEIADASNQEQETKSVSGNKKGVPPTSAANIFIGDIPMVDYPDDDASDPSDLIS